MKILAANFKMNLTLNEINEYIDKIKDIDNKNIVLIPSNIYIPYFLNKKFSVGVQDAYYLDNGAFTGEVSVEMLEDVGVTYCVIGHSERRSMFGDTDETVNLKASKLLDENIIPILCIGETEAQYDAGETEKVIREQISGSMKGLCPHCVGKMVVAYEPIWAIGTGKSATKEIAQNCCHIVRDQIRVMFGDEAADKVRIQYGGSVKPENIKEYMACEDIDGALIGGASLKVDSFKAIIDATK